MPSACARSLLISASLVLSIGFAGNASAQLEAAPAAPDLYGAGTMRGRLAVRMLADFDLNHDGKITRDELKKALAQRFAQAGGGVHGLTEAQFVKAQQPFFDAEVARQFRKLDWNKDGVLSLDEFRQGLRVRFDKLDRDGSGAIVCRAASAATATGGAPRRGAGGAVIKFCQEADLNHDGKVTRDEFDRAVAARYAAIVKGGKGMTQAEFIQSEQPRFAAMEAKRFRRLSGGNPTMSLADYSAPALKLFDKLDRNHDGVLSPDELANPSRGRQVAGAQGKPKSPR